MGNMKIKIDTFCRPWDIETTEGDEKGDWQ